MQLHRHRSFFVFISGLLLVVLSEFDNYCFVAICTFPLLMARASAADGIVVLPDIVRVVLETGLIPDESLALWVIGWQDQIGKLEDKPDRECTTFCPSSLLYSCCRSDC